MNSLDCSFRVGTCIVQTFTVVRDLGLHLDNELSMKQDVTKVAATCYYHLRRLRQIRRRVGSEVTTQLVLALIIWRLDYCNTALAGLPQTMIAPLQRVQNAVACLVFELGSREDVTPCLLQLHWLPVCWRIQFKLCCIMHSVFNGNCLAYLSDIVQRVSASRPRLYLRSSSLTDHVLPRLRTKFGEHAFSHAGPSAWNRLPEDIHAEPDITNFRKLLKTHCCNSVFNVQ